MDDNEMLNEGGGKWKMENGGITEKVRGQSRAPGGRKRNDREGNVHARLRMTKWRELAGSSID